MRDEERTNDERDDNDTDHNRLLSQAGIAIQYRFGQRILVLPQSAIDIEYNNRHLV